MSEGVETCSGANLAIKGVADGVADLEIDHQVIETAVGMTQMVCVYPRIEISVAECVETPSGTHLTMDGVADGVPNSQVYHQIVDALLSNPVLTLT